MMHALAGFNLLLGLAGFGWMLLRTSQRWSEYPHELQLILTAGLVLFLALLAISLEQFDHGTDGWDTPLITFGKLYVLYVLWATRNTLYRTGTRTGNGDIANADRDIT